MRRWFTWNVLFRLHELAKGHDTYTMLRDMEAADRLSAAELAELQRRKLRELIEYSFAHVPYVRNRMTEAGLTPADVRGPEDLCRLPLMRKSDVRENRTALRSDIA